MILSLLKLIRLFVGWIDLLVVTVLLYVLSFIPDKLTSKYYRPLFYYWCNTFVRALNVNLRLHQKNHRPLPKQYILISNHPSAFEDIGMPALFKARFLAKKEVKDWLWVGRISRAAGTLFFDREDKEARQDAVAELKKVLATGDSIGLYPEGGCKGRRIHLPFRYGAFDLSLQTGIPILPVFLHYEAQETFEWAGETLPQKIWTMLRAKNKTAHYYVYDAISPQQFSDKAEFCNHVQDCYLEWQRRYLD